jgi:hypothetical protein
VISGREFAAALTRYRFDFFTGVRCSLVKDVIATLEAGVGAPYVAAVREDAAVGMAAGVRAHAELRHRHQPERARVAVAHVRPARAKPAQSSDVRP